MNKFEKVANMGHLKGSDIIRLLNMKVDHERLYQAINDRKGEIMSNVTQHNSLYRFMVERDNASR